MTIKKCSHCYGTGEEPDTYDISAKDPITKCHKCKGTGNEKGGSGVEGRTDHFHLPCVRLPRVAFLYPH